MNQIYDCGKFITVESPSPKTCFTLKREFLTRGTPASAKLTASALGLYCVEINGQRVGDARFLPGWTNYKTRLQYQEFDITPLIADGVNLVSMTVAAGWYCGHIGFGGGVHKYGMQPAGWAVLELEYADGTVEQIVTDKTWEASDCFIRDSDLYNGETQDFIAPIKQYGVTVAEFDMRKLIPQEGETVRITQQLPALKKLISPKGEQIFDFGQNLTGVVRLQASVPSGTVIRVRHAEVLDQEGNFYTENLRAAKAEDVYISDGTKRSFMPEFTFHGFRYALVEGADLEKESVVAQCIHSDLRRTGRITTSNAAVNRLIENIVWSQRDNYLDIPTDCPQRDERLGWTADANVFCRTAAYNYDVRRFFHKWLADLRSEQTESGELPVVAPDVIGWVNTAALWGDCITMIPWTLYEMYGDKTFLSENIGAMKKWISAVEKTTKDGLIVTGFQYGDWLGLDREVGLPASHCAGATDVYFVANVFYLRSLCIVADSAFVLGDQETEKVYRAKYHALLDAMHREYFTMSGRMVSETQTGMALALYFNIVPKDARARIAQMLNENVVAHAYHMSTGFAGTPYLLFALSDNGYHETASKVLMNNEFPGWLYEVRMGATTIWERWNGIRPDGSIFEPDMNSFNHYAYGSVGEFLYRRVAGIECASAGFEHICICPRPVEGLDRVCAEFESARGRICAGYEKTGERYRFFAEVPEDVMAKFILPSGEERAFCKKFETIVSPVKGN